jgi:hypothetical protein
VPGGEQAQGAALVRLELGEVAPGAVVQIDAVAELVAVRRGGVAVELVVDVGCSTRACARARARGRALRA